MKDKAMNICFLSGHVALLTQSIRQEKARTMSWWQFEGWV